MMTVDEAIAKAEQWRKENACGDAAKVAIALLGELESMRAEVREWLCENCNTVYPGPPSPGLTCVVCPGCGGTTGLRGIIEKRKLQNKVRALLSKAIPEGYVVVPKEPTQEMRAIGYESYRSTLNNPKWVEFMFKAMIAAAPSVEGEGA